MRCQSARSPTRATPSFFIRLCRVDGLSPRISAAPERIVARSSTLAELADVPRPRVAPAASSSAAGVTAAPRRPVRAPAPRERHRTAPRGLRAARAAGAGGAGTREPVVEVARGSSPRRRRLEVDVGRRDDPHVDLHGARRCPRPRRCPLGDPQELGLQVQRQLADLVEQQRAAVGRLEAPRPVAGGAREAPLHVPEELALQQLARDRRAVDLHEGPLGPRAPQVERAREPLLARCPSRPAPAPGCRCAPPAARARRRPPHARLSATLESHPVVVPELLLERRAWSRCWAWSRSRAARCAAFSSAIASTWA
jgi:hypothetical protein